MQTVLLTLETPLATASTQSERTVTQGDGAAVTFFEWDLIAESLQLVQLAALLDRERHVLLHRVQLRRHRCVRSEPVRDESDPLWSVGQPALPQEGCVQVRQRGELVVDVAQLAGSHGSAGSRLEDHQRYPVAVRGWSLAASSCASAKHRAVFVPTRRPSPDKARTIDCWPDRRISAASRSPRSTTSRRSRSRAWTGSGVPFV